jgi:hypothetical protein
MSAIAPLGALAPSAPLSGFSSTIDALRLAVRAAAASCATDGGSGAPPPPSLPVLSDGFEALKKTLPGSVLVLADGTFRVTGLETPFGTNRVVTLSDISVQDKVGGTAVFKKQEWLIGNVKAVYMGILSEGVHEGSRAAELMLHGQSVRIEVGGADGDAISELKVTVLGAPPISKGVVAAMDLLGVPARAFKGGQAVANLLSGGTTPDASAVAATIVTGVDLSLGSPMEPLYSARLQMLGLFSTGASSATAPQVASLICGVVGTPSLGEAISLSLSCSSSVIGAGPTSQQAAVMGCRTALLAAFARVIADMPTRALERAVIMLADLTSAGFPLGPGNGGGILFSAITEVLAGAAATVPPAVPSALALALPLVASPMPGGALPAVGAGLSPESAMEAEIAVRRQALEALRAARGVAFPASRASVDPPPLIGPAPLTGLAFLRPIPAPPAAPPSDLELLTALGGAEVVRRLAASKGDAAPLVVMTGDGSAATAAQAASDFSSILAVVRASIHSPTAEGAALLNSTSSPADMEAAGTRLRITLRLHQEVRLGQRISAIASPDQMVAHRQRNSDRLVKALPSTAPPDRVFRAVGASLLEPLCSESSATARVASRGIPLREPVDEARRLIDIFGRNSVGYILSSGEVDGETSSDPHGHLVACRTSLSGYISRWLEDVATPQRARSVAAETQLLRGDLQSLDLNWNRIQVRCGGLPPKGAQWLAARPELAASGNAAILGRWGTTTGPLAYGDCERAARIFGPMLILLQVDIAGGPPASDGDETLGLLPLIQATAGISDESRSALLQEAVERFALQQHEVRVNPTAKPADPEAIFLDAQIHAVQPISDAAASVQAGAAAGAAAAKAAIDAHNAANKASKVPAVALSGAAAAASTTWAEKRKAERDAKRLAAKKQSTAGASTSTAIVVASPTPQPASGKPAPAAAATTATGGGNVQVKQWEPFASGEPAAASIISLCDKKGGGLVEVLDRLHHFASPTLSTDKFPCPWLAATGKCSTHVDPARTCRKCEHGAVHSAEILSKAKAAVAPSLRLAPASAVAQAA